MQIFFQGLDVASTQFAQTDLHGAYRAEGLKAGRYRWQVMDSSLNLLKRSELDIHGDLTFDVTLHSGRLRGRVFDASTGAPLEAAEISAEAVYKDGVTFPRVLRKTTNGLGEFDLELAAGFWQVRAEKEGYGTELVTLEMPPAEDLTGLELTLEPTAGLHLTVDRPQTADVGPIYLALLDAQGAVRTSTTVLTGADGRVHFAAAPAGRFELLVTADGTAPKRAAFQAVR